MNMNNRRRPSSMASRGADGDDSDDAFELSNPGPPPSTRNRKRLHPEEICQQLYDTIRSYKKGNGTLLCDSFIRAPLKCREPQYYEVVSQPIDLLRIQHKIDTYEEVEELSADIELLVNNAKAFYKPDSVEYKDAIELWKLYAQTKQALEHGQDTKLLKLSRNYSSNRRPDVAECLSGNSTKNEAENDILERLNVIATCRKLYDTIRYYKKEDGTFLCYSFIRAPKRRQEPQYYEVVSQPMDLLRVRMKLTGYIYKDIEELSADIELLVNNAKAFYKPDSVEYKDAIELWKLYVQTKQALEHGTKHSSDETYDISQCLLLPDGNNLNKRKRLQEINDQNVLEDEMDSSDSNKEKIPNECQDNTQDLLEKVYEEHSANETPLTNTNSEDNAEVQCIHCTIDKELDKRNYYFGNLLNGELQFLPPCIRTNAYINILKYVDTLKHKHVDKPLDYQEGETMFHF